MMITIEPIIFMITNVLQPSSKPLSYTPRRSRFSIEQRYEQLKETIESILSLPQKNIQIVLVEGSEDLTCIWKNKMEELSKTIDIYFVSNQQFISSLYKGQGEAFLVAKGLDYVTQKYPLVKTMVKISGRYKLNSSFSFQRNLSENKNKNIFRKIESGSYFDERVPCVYTMLYIIIGYPSFTKVRALCQKIMDTQAKESVERLFYLEFENDPNTIFVDFPLGIEGFVSHSRKFIQK